MTFKSKTVRKDMIVNEQSKIKFQFTQLIDAFTALTDSIQKNVAFVDNRIPILFLNSGEETYWYERKWGKKGDEKFQEIYQRTPRGVLDFPDDITVAIEQNTQKNIPYTLKQNDVDLATNGRRQALTIPMILDFVCSNSVKAFQYFEMWLCLLNVDNVFSYESSSNTYQGKWGMQNIQIIKPGIGPSGDTRNWVLKINLEIQLQLMINNLKFITEVGANTKPMDVIFDLISHDSDGENPQHHNIQNIFEND